MKGRPSRVGVLLMLASGLALAPPKGHGWGLTWTGANIEAAIKAARGKFGPFRVDAAITLTDAGYDSNIYFGAPEAAIGDYAFTAGTDWHIYLPIRKLLVFEVVETPRYEYFVRTQKERSWDNSFLGRVHLVGNRLYANFSQGLTSTRSLWSPEADLRIRRREDSRQGLILWQASQGISFSLAYERLKYRHDNQGTEFAFVSERLDRTEEYLGLTAYYQVSPRVQWFVDGEYGTFEFDATPERREVRSYRASAGANFLLGGPFQGRIDLGYKAFRALDTSQKNAAGVFGKTSLTVSLTRATEIRALFERDIQFSVWYDNTSFIVTAFGGGLSKALTRKIWLTYEIRFGRNQYALRATDGTGAWEDKLDRQVSHTAGIRMRLRRNLEMAVRGTWVNRKSDLSWANGRRSLAGMSLTYRL